MYTSQSDLVSFKVYLVWLQETDCHLTDLTDSVSWQTFALVASDRLMSAYY